MSRHAAVMRHQYEGMPLVRQPRESRPRPPPMATYTFTQSRPGSILGLNSHKFNPNAQVFVPKQSADNQLTSQSNPHKNPYESRPYLPCARMDNLPPPPPSEVGMPSGGPPGVPAANTPPVYTIHFVNSTTSNVDTIGSNVCLNSAPAGSYTASGQYSMQFTAPVAPQAPPSAGPALVYHTNTHYVYS